MEKWVHGNFDEFIDWHDTDGNIINASDGGIIYADGKYHWYGQALRDLPYNSRDGLLNGGVGTVGVVMYESDDLYNWRYEGVILACSDDPESELRAPMRFERPKIIYNEKTKQYVLWCHYVSYPGQHGFAKGKGEAGVAVCDTVNGQYRWLGTSRPIDDDGVVRDSTLYKDADGSAYFVYDRDVSERDGKGSRCIYIVKLADDYLSCTSEYRRIDAAFLREAPAITYRDGYYYMITSGLTGWEYNQAKYFRSRSLLGEWEDMGDPCVDDKEKKTFCTQTTAIFQVEGRDDCYIHMAERHNYMHSFLHCSYIWLPIHFGEDHTMSISYLKEWKLP